MRHYLILGLGRPGLKRAAVVVPDLTSTYVITRTGCVIYWNIGTGMTIIAHARACAICV